MTEHIESQIGCSLPWGKRQVHGQLPICQTQGDLDNLNVVFDTLSDVNQPYLTSELGCPTACDFFKYSAQVTMNDRTTRLKASEMFNVSRLPDKALGLRLYFTGTHFDSVQEVEKYPMSQVVANVGGFLGLLLGHSLLEILFTSVDKFCHVMAIVTDRREKKQSIVSN